ncbi:MAG: hypothetical protein HY777_15420 [Betaproteobacteria bacterium]|nr:hypothetical protein [Betaproteobacteria bacterium]
MVIARPSHLVFTALLCATGVFAATFADAAWLRHRRADVMTQKRDLVARLQLTDLCLFTEARYTRHLSQADLHSAFQDHPLGLEHFPSGSLVPPPAHLMVPHEALDRKTEVPD